MEKNRDYRWYFEVVGVLGCLRLSVPFVVMGLRGSGWDGPPVASFIDLLPVDCIESDGVRLWDFVGRGAMFWELDGIEERTRVEWKEICSDSFGITK